MLVERGRLIKVMTGYGSFCRVFLLKNTFYVFAKSSEREYSVRCYDKNWQFTGFKKILTPEDKRRPGDIDIAFDGECFYLSHGRYVFKFDAEINLITTTEFDRDKNDRFTDQNIEVIDGKVILGSEYRENNTLWNSQPKALKNMPPNSEVARASLIRIFDTNLTLLDKINLIANVEGAEVPHQYWGMGTSQIQVDGYYCPVVHAPIGNYEYFDQGESKGTRQVFILRFDEEFNFVDSKGPLTDLNNDNYWSEGSVYEDGKYYISYTYRIPGQGSVLGPRIPEPNGTIEADRGNIRLSIYDEDLNELTMVDITDINVKQSGVTGAAHRPHILKVGNTLYVTYDYNREGWMQEIILKK